MGRQDRIMPEPRAIELLETAEMGVLSMVTPDGKAYGIPVNFVWSRDEDSIYFHCALEGKKMNCMRNNPHVSFCICGKSRVVPATLSTERESIVLECEAAADLPTEEKRKGLRLMMKKLDNEHIGMAKCIDSAIDKVSVVRLDIVSFSGKAKYFNKI